MLRVTSSLVIVLYLSLSVALFSQATPASVPEPEVIYGASSVEWPATVPDAGLLLTVSGPAGLYLRQENPAGTWGRFSLATEQGQVRPDGVYKWELVVQAGWEVEQANQVESGWFQIQNGQVVAEGIGDKQPVVVEEQAPASSLYVDSQGRVGLGTSVPASQLHLKGSNPAFTLEDTTSGGGLFTWRALEKGDGSLGLFDKTGQDRWFVDGEGRIGIGTTKPTSTLTVDGYIETTKGFLVNGRPVGVGFGLIGGSRPLYTEGSSNNFFGTEAGAANAGNANNFFGAYAGNSNTGGSHNNFFGYEAGRANVTGQQNSFFGHMAGRMSNGYYNSFFGSLAGAANTSGSENSFFGNLAGYSNTTGADNSFFGIAAGYSNTTGRYNCFFGVAAGGDSGTGDDNSFFGSFAGRRNTTGYWNSFFGRDAGFWNTTGQNNSFFGRQAGYGNSTGSYNAFFGEYAGHGNSTGSYNAFFGDFAGASNAVGTRNTLVGYDAQLNTGAGIITNATAIGAHSYVAQSNSLVLGSINGVNDATSYVNVGIGTTTPVRQLHLKGPNAVLRMDRSTDTASFIMVRTDPTGVTPWKTFVVGTNATGVNQGEFIINDIGTAVGGGGSRRMTISNSGEVTFTGNVYGLSFVPTSSAAFKTNIRTFANALETVNRLRGVRFDWKDTGKPAVGLIAEEVDEVVPEVVAHEGDKARGVNYANLVAVLVEAVKEQQKTIEEQQEALEEQRRTNQEQGARLDKLEKLLAER